MWHKLKNSLQAATVSLALVVSLMAVGQMHDVLSADSSAQHERTLTGMTPQAEQLVITVAAKLAAAVIDEALVDAASAPESTEKSEQSQTQRRNRASLNQRIPFFSFAARPARSQGS